jgi:hypothetical protein
MLFTTKGHFLPYLSAAIPKRIDPTERNISTRVIPQVISALVLPKSAAKSLTVKLTVKKSKASQVCRELALFQPMTRWHGYPSNEADGEEGPLSTIQHGQQPEGIRRLVHGRLEGGKPGREIAANAYLRWGGALMELLNLLFSGRAQGGLSGGVGIGHGVLWTERTAMARHKLYRWPSAFDRNVFDL